MLAFQDALAAAQHLTSIGAQCREVLLPARRQLEIGTRPQRAPANRASVSGQRLGQPGRVRRARRQVAEDQDVPGQRPQRRHDSVEVRFGQREDVQLVGTPEIADRPGEGGGSLPPKYNVPQGQRQDRLDPARAAQHQRPARAQLRLRSRTRPSLVPGPAREGRGKRVLSQPLPFGGELSERIEKRHARDRGRAAVQGQRAHSAGVRTPPRSRAVFDMSMVLPVARVEPGRRAPGEAPDVASPAALEGQLRALRSLELRSTTISR